MGSSVQPTVPDALRTLYTPPFTSVFTLNGTVVVDSRGVSVHPDGIVIALNWIAEQGK